MLININKKNLITFLFYIPICIVLFYLDNPNLVLLTNSIFLIVLLYKCKDNSIMMFFFFIILIYSIPMYLHYTSGIQLSVYTKLNNEINYYRFTLIQTMFLNNFIIWLKKFDKNVKGILFSHSNKYQSNILYIFMLFLMLICFVFGKTGSSILSSGGYGNNSFYGSALYEYFYIFYLLAYIFSSNCKYKKRVLFIFALIYSGKSLLYGGRIEVMQMAILVLCLYFHEISSIKLVCILILGYILMLLIGNFRGNLSFEFSSLAELFGYNERKNILISNESDVFYSSMVIVSSIKDNIITFSYRLTSIIYWLLRLIIPSSFINSKYNIIVHLQSTYAACGGGAFFSSIIYFYFGNLGLIFFSVFLAKIFNNINSDKTIYNKIFLILFITMIPRWYAYSSESFFKIPIYGVICFFIINMIIKQKRKYWLLK